MKVNKTLLPCTQNVVKTIKATSYLHGDEGPASEPTEGEGPRLGLCDSQDGRGVMVSPNKENIVKPQFSEPLSVVPSVTSALPEPKLSSFAITDTCTSDTKELTELERLKQRFLAQQVKTKKTPQANIAAIPSAVESQSLIPPELMLELKDKPGRWSVWEGKPVGELSAFVMLGYTHQVPYVTT